MRIDEANENREKRKAQTRVFLREAGLLEVVDEVRRVFGDDVRLEWAKFGDRVIGRDAYEASVAEAKRHQARLREWQKVLQRKGKR